MKKNAAEIAIISFSFLFSFWLMFSTFSYSNGSMLIATKAWSDFGSHIPLIRSFSLGENFPVEYPLFSGEPIRYHFLFYALVGLLERIGLRIDYALNIPSLLSFAALLFGIYLLGKSLFKSKAVGMLSVIFFLFNGSFAFLEFFKLHPISLHTFQDIITNTTFPSFGPYDGRVVSAFWNLNIFTNQRHLAASYAFSLMLIILLLRMTKSEKKHVVESILLGVFLGCSFFFHQAVFLMNMVILATFFVLFSKLRLSVFLIGVIAAAIALPQYLTLRPIHAGFIPTLTFGYLLKNSLTVFSFLHYWFLNFGLHMVLIPMGFLSSPQNAKKVFIPFVLFFITGNSVQFSPEIAANHKFFNYFLLVGGMFSAYMLVLLWNKKHIFRPFVVILFFLLTFSGVIDFFPIYNDTRGGINDYPKNENIKWIMNNTDPSSVFLNTTYFYTPASLAGRKIFLGWPYFAWSQGYNTGKRYDIMRRLLSPKDKNIACKLLRENNIDYVEIKIQNPPDPNIPPILNLYNQSFVKPYENSLENYSIYDIEISCK